MALELEPGEPVGRPGRGGSDGGAVLGVAGPGQVVVWSTPDGLLREDAGSMAEDTGEGPVIELPRFDEAVRRSVPDDHQNDLDDFEELLDSWIARFTKARAAARYEERRLQETGLVTARRQGVYVLAAAAIRILDLGAGIILLVNARRAHAAFAVARALFETSASLTYLDEEVSPRLAKGRKDQVAEKLSRMRVGLDPGVALEDDEGAMPTPIPVSSMIKALARQADKAMPETETETETEAEAEEENDEEAQEESAGETMKRLYSVVSDFTHPNHSAGHLSSSIDQTTWMMDWTFDHAWDESTAFHVLGATDLAMHYAREAFDAFMGALTKSPLVLDDKRRGRTD
jgi:hypothetical protein